MISKELLAEVLCKRIKYFRVEGPVVKIRFDGAHIEQQTYFEINIYELAHKCKEWAFGSGYLFSSGIKWQDKVYCDVFSPFKFDKCVASFSAMEEPEAIFKACQWILDNKADK